MISYEVERDLVPLILSNCQYSVEKGGETLQEFNLEKIQQQVTSRFLQGKPLITLVVRRMGASCNLLQTTLQPVLVFISLLYSWHVLQQRRPKCIPPRSTSCRPYFTRVRSLSPNREYPPWCTDMTGIMSICLTM